MTNEEIFNDNIRLVYKIAQRYKITYPDEYDDILQCAFMGLWKAVLIFNGSHKISTLAYRIMSNEINMYIRKHHRNKILNEAISMDQIIFVNNDGHDVSFGEMIKDESDPIDEMLYSIDVEIGMDKMFLNETEKQVVRLRMDKKSQHYISRKLGLSQPQISRIQKKVKNRLLDLIHRKEGKCMDTKNTKLELNEKEIDNIKREYAMMKKFIFENGLWLNFLNSNEFIKYLNER